MHWFYDTHQIACFLRTHKLGLTTIALYTTRRATQSKYYECLMHIHGEFSLCFINDLNSVNFIMYRFLLRDPVHPKGMKDPSRDSSLFSWTSFHVFAYVLLCVWVSVKRKERITRLSPRAQRWMAPSALLYIGSRWPYQRPTKTQSCLFMHTSNGLTNLSFLSLAIFYQIEKDIENKKQKQTNFS